LHCRYAEIWHISIWASFILYRKFYFCFLCIMLISYHLLYSLFICGLVISFICNNFIGGSITIFLVQKASAAEAKWEALLQSDFVVACNFLLQENLLLTGAFWYLAVQVDSNNARIEWRNCYVLNRVVLLPLVYVQANLWCLKHQFMDIKVCGITGLLATKIQNKHSLLTQPKVRLAYFLIVVFSGVIIRLLYFLIRTSFVKLSYHDGMRHSFFSSIINTP
jgi:hypothetical protein